MTQIKPELVDRLSDAVRARGMVKLLHHEVLSKGIFSKNFTSGLGPAESWKDQLRNREDGILVLRFKVEIFAQVHCCTFGCSHHGRSHSNF